LTKHNTELKIRIFELEQQISQEQEKIQQLENEVRVVTKDKQFHKENAEN